MAITTRLLEGDSPQLILDDAELRVVAGPDKGVRVPLALRSITIGSHEGCDLVLHDETVSGRHARIDLTTTGYVIEDLGSKNGLVIGDVRVLRLQLADGMKIRIGASAVQVRSLGATRSVALGKPRRLGSMIAHSVRMRAVASQIEQIAQSDATVLLEGETGTGKEVAAQAVHECSLRRHGPLVVFDCGAQSPELIAAELFGHEAGAFTGATHARPGALVEAEGGTILLDEVGELPLELQPLLLRMLENRETRRIGGGLQVHDVRVVAATNRNLDEEVRAGRFRQDLFYRLAVCRIHLPPLRQRREDIPHLAQMFAEAEGARLTTELMTLFLAHDWPGNVRELRHMIARAAISPDPAFVAPEIDARPGLRPLPDARRDATDDFERAYVEKALALADGSVTRAAALAGVSRQMMTKLVAKHGIRRAP